MLLEELSFIGFRNLDSQRLEPAAGFNVIWGNNAQGKTNIIEAIYLLGQLKSFRTSIRESLIKKDNDTARLTALIKNSEVRHKLILTLNKEGKNGSFDGKRITSDGDILGKLKVVLFAPEEISLIREIRQDAGHC